MSNYPNSGYYQNNAQYPNNIQYGDPRPYSNNMGMNPSMNAQANYSNVRPYQPTYIPGRMIMTENDIVANEVPMDGNYGTFIQQDLKAIYLKTWGKDGLIDTKTYQLVEDNQDRLQPQIDLYTEIMTRLDNIEKCLKTRPRKKPYKPYNDQNKEE